MFVGFRIGMGLEPSSLPVGCLERMVRLTQASLAVLAYSSSRLGESAEESSSFPLLWA